MKFLLELPENNQEVSIEVHALKEAIAVHPYASYAMAVSNYFSNLGPWFDIPERLRDELFDSIPVGSIDFVQSYLNKAYSIPVMQPIEIPERLRMPKMLLRDYAIVKYEDLPQRGTWFIKNVSGLKKGTYCGPVEKLRDENHGMELNQDHIYQVSSVLNIVTEYRVFVHRDRIVGIQYYDGDVLVMPTPTEIKKIQEAVVRYSVSKDCPDAYTMDWAIVNTGCKKEPRDIALLEVHPFVSVGTYGLEGPILVDMYKNGLQWYIKYNTPLTPEEKGGNTYAFF